MKRCQKCGQSNPDEADLCSDCGTGLSPGHTDKEPPADNDAPDYGALASSILEKSLIPDEDYRDRVRQEKRADAPAELSPELTNCERCGAVNRLAQLNCKNCGALLGAETEDDLAQTRGEPSETPLAGTVEEPFSSTPADLPVSDYYATMRPEPRRRRLKFFTGISYWGVRQWLLLLILTVVIAFATWLFAYGGMDTIFSSQVNNIRKAEKAMVGLGSFQFSIAASLETSQVGEYGGTGTVSFESPDRSAWDFSVDIPGVKPLRAQLIQVGKQPYINVGGSWTPQNPSIVDADVRNLFRAPSDVEDLGSQVLGTSTCFHYKYRTSPELITGLLGIRQTTGSSDAVIEIWIDSSSNLIMRLTVGVYNVRLEGMRARVSLNMELAALGQPYDIKPPVEGNGSSGSNPLRLLHSLLMASN